MRWFFDVSKMKESSYFKSDLTDPHQIFDAHLLETTDLSTSRFHFSVGFFYQDHVLSQMVLYLIRTNEIGAKKNIVCSKFELQTNQPSITSFYTKRFLFLPN